KYALPANTIVPAKGFLVLVCDDSGTGLSTNFKLTSDGETVYLENTAGALVDKVEFPSLNDGQSYGRYPDGSPSLAISGNVSRGISNGDTQAPVISNTLQTPLVPALSDPVTIKTEFVTTTGITSVKLFYRLNGGPFTESAMTPGSGFYSGTIPAQNTTGKIEYYIEAKNNSNKTALDPFDAPSGTYNYLLNTDVLPLLFINEFMAANTACCADTDSGTNEFDDWVEIYNAGEQPINIGGMYLSDNKANPFKYKIPTDNAAATTIPAGGFLLLWADGAKGQGPLHIDFSLANAGEDIGIYYIDGREINAYSFGVQAENKSVGRSPNGSGTWTTQAAPSPGLSNN
ncbi:MAG: hypothetical protein C0490_19190, partial [Marivirga sp.]|nr:hypothetical protein [Marivirga sp.]